MPRSAELLYKLVGSGRATIPQLIRARVEQTPDLAFLLVDDRRWTYPGSRPNDLPGSSKAAMSAERATAWQASVAPR